MLLRLVTASYSHDLECNPRTKKKCSFLGAGLGFGFYELSSLQEHFGEG